MTNTFKAIEVAHDYISEIQDYYPGFVACFHPENMAPNLHLNKGMNYE